MVKAVINEKTKRPVRLEKGKTATLRDKLTLVDASTQYLLLKVVFITPKVVEITIRIIYNWKHNKAIKIEGDIVPLDLTEKGLLEYYVSYCSTILDHAVEEIDTYIDLLTDEYDKEKDEEEGHSELDGCACDIGGRTALPLPKDEEEDDERFLLGSGYSVM